MHYGDGDTYTNPTGGTSRKNYIMISADWVPAVTASFVEDCIDLALSRDDHRPIALELSFYKSVKDKLYMPFRNTIHNSWKTSKFVLRLST